MLLLFHSCVVALNVYAMCYDQLYVDIPYPTKEYAALPLKARGMFLTFWCLVLQTVYFTIALVNDVIGTNATAPKKPPLIRNIKDLLFSLTFTTAMYVATAFWILYFVRKDLIFPPDAEEQIPTWLNHTMHTFILPFIMLELFLCKRNYPSRNLGLGITLLFNFIYVCGIHTLYFLSGVWVYPFLNVLNWPMIIMYFVFSAVLCIMFYDLGEKLNSMSSLEVRVSCKKI